MRDFKAIYDCKDHLFNPLAKSRDVDGNSCSSTLVSAMPACPFAIFTYTDFIHLTTNGLIGPCQTRTHATILGTVLSRPWGTRIKWQPVEGSGYKTIHCLFHPHIYNALYIKTIASCLTLQHGEYLQYSDKLT